MTALRAGADADILPLLRRLRLARGARVLDVPCGYGRHAILLARRGYRVTGLDISEKLLAMARAAASRAKAPGKKAGRNVAAKAATHNATRSLQIDFRRGDMRRLKYRGKFHAVLNLFTSFGYFGDREDRQVLKGFYRALRPGGWLVIHVANRDWIVLNYQPVGRVKLPGGFHLTEKRRLDPVTSISRGEWIVRKGKKRLRGVTEIRFYSPHELAQMLRDAGFRKVQVLGGFRGQPLKLGSRWQLFLAKK